MGVYTVLLPDDGMRMACERLDPMLRGWAPLYSRGIDAGYWAGNHPEDVWIVMTTNGPRLLAITCPIPLPPPLGPDPARSVALITIAGIPPPLEEALGLRDGALHAELQIPAGPDWRSGPACPSSSSAGVPL